MHFRPATPADAEPIRALVREAYAKWVPLIGREPMPMTVDYTIAVREHRIELAEDAGHLVGLIETIPQPDHLFVENVAVRPSAQGNGLGGQLMARAEAQARAQNLPELRLLTNAAFATNIALYERLGYLTTHTEPFRGGTTVYMTKRLS